MHCPKTKTGGCPGHRWGYEGTVRGKIGAETLSINVFSVCEPWPRRFPGYHFLVFI